MKKSKNKSPLSLFGIYAVIYNDTFITDSARAEAASDRIFSAQGRRSHCFWALLFLFGDRPLRNRTFRWLFYNFMTSFESEEEEAAVASAVRFVSNARRLGQKRDKMPKLNRGRDLFCKSNCGNFPSGYYFFPGTRSAWIGSTYMQKFTEFQVNLLEVRSFITLRVGKEDWS